MKREPRPGDRIRLLSMADDPDPIEPGATGTVTAACKHGSGRQAWWQVQVEWDNGRGLMLSLPADRIEYLPSEGE
jgi:hypothetical protein